MLCEICGQREASIHITETINNKTVEMHICEACGEKKGVINSQSFVLSDLLAGMIDFDMEVGAKRGDTVKSCSNCGMNFEDFRKTGRFGCADCYETFKEVILPLLKKIHGSPQHSGKRLKKASEIVEKESEVEQFQRKLKEAVEKEDFEKAAELRDKIKTLEKKKRKK